MDDCVREMVQDARRRRPASPSAVAVPEGIGLDADDHTAHTAPGLDQRRTAPRQIALDDATSDAARVDVAPVADVDADVADPGLPPLAEGEKVARSQVALVAVDLETGLRLLCSGARELDLQRCHHVADQPTAIEAARRRASEDVPGADLGARDSDERVAKAVNGLAPRGEGATRLGALATRGGLRGGRRGARDDERTPEQWAHERTVRARETSEQHREADGERSRAGRAACPTTRRNRDAARVHAW